MHINNNVNTIRAVIMTIKVVNSCFVIGSPTVYQVS